MQRDIEIYKLAVKYFRCSESHWHTYSPREAALPCAVTNDTIHPEKKICLTGVCYLLWLFLISELGDSDLNHQRDGKKLKWK